jgi:hypothetical protein
VLWWWDLRSQFHGCSEFLVRALQVGVLGGCSCCDTGDCAAIGSSDVVLGVSDSRGRTYGPRSRCTG